MKFSIYYVCYIQYVYYLRGICFNHHYFRTVFVSRQTKQLWVLAVYRRQHYKNSEEKTKTLNNKDPYTNNYYIWIRATSNTVILQFIYILYTLNRGKQFKAKCLLGMLEMSNNFCSRPKEGKNVPICTEIET